MSLNWDATRCGENWTALDDRTQTALIFNTMAVGVGKVTEDNLIEWVARTRFWDRIFGFDKDRLPDAALIAAVGLSTNVTTETRAKWLGRVSKSVMLEAEYDAKRALK